MGNAEFAQAVRSHYNGPDPGSGLARAVSPRIDTSDDLLADVTDGNCASFLSNASYTISRDETAGDAATLSRLLEQYGKKLRSDVKLESPSSPDIAEVDETHQEQTESNGSINLDFLRNNANFQQLRTLVQQQPAMLEPILQQVAEGNPQLALLIGQNQESFLSLLNEDMGPEPSGAQTISVTEEEREAIERLGRLGFTRDTVIQAYFACGKNEELTANFLFDQSRDEEDMDGEPQSQSPVPGTNDGAPGYDLRLEDSQGSTSERPDLKTARLERARIPQLATSPNEAPGAVGPSTVIPGSLRAGVPALPLFNLPPTSNSGMRSGISDSMELRSRSAENTRQVSNLRTPQDPVDHRNSLEYTRPTHSPNEDPDIRTQMNGSERRRNLLLQNYFDNHIPNANIPTRKPPPQIPKKSDHLRSPSPSTKQHVSPNQGEGSDSFVPSIVTIPYEQQSRPFSLGKGLPVRVSTPNTAFTMNNQEVPSTNAQVSSRNGNPGLGPQETGPAMGPNLVPRTAAANSSYRLGTTYFLNDIDDSNRMELERLRQENASLRISLTEKSSPRWLKLHRVTRTGQAHVYFDSPIFSAGHLKGLEPALNLDYYLHLHKEVSLIVYEDYECEKTEESSEMLSALRADSLVASTPVAEVPKPSRESFVIISDDLRKALSAIADQYTNVKDSPVFPDFTLKQEIQAPYLFYFHNRDFFKEKVEGLKQDLRLQANVFLSYIGTRFGQVFEEIDTSFAKGSVTTDSFIYLYSPNNVLVTKERGSYMAYFQEGLPTISVNDHGIAITVKVGHFAFDGSFEFRHKFLEVSWDDEPAKIPEKSIKQLAVFPLRYADDGIEQALKDRGRKFWSCRTQRYVSYTSQTYGAKESMTDARFMVDVATYRRMHPHMISTKMRDDLGAAVMENDEPPDGLAVMLFPQEIYGFDMREKKWINMQVDRIKPVVWNKSAFESLVIDEDTKDLIQALVTNQLAAEASTDVIENKGVGLIILLHGGPGTGKTLTAESVAEIAEKPLYRVTCGDIGTSPELVEEYLETVLFLGKIWGCVVLLDEADVFLEQRSLADLQRNALVSVFLRVLEYYEGILILTSNRVATFDEAFKSRIQLALHYDALTETQRQQIWKNFVKRLETVADDSVETADIEYNIKELAAYSMNGRQIRNVITTARQLALYKKKKMGFAHLKHVIKVAGKFDTYLKTVHEEISDEQWARELGVR